MDPLTRPNGGNDAPAPGTRPADVDRRYHVLEGQNRVLEKLAKGAPLAHVGRTFALVMENLCEDVSCAFLMLDVDATRLRLVAAPSLPESLCRSLEDQDLEQSANPAVVSVLRREPVLVENTSQDALWAEAREAMREAGYCACLSQPVLDAGGAAIGAIALYLRHATTLDAIEIKTVDTLIPSARMALERESRAQALKSADDRLLSLAENIPGVVYQRVVTPERPVSTTFDQR